MKKVFILFMPVVMLTACNSGNNKFDAQGTFETDEVIVSSELAGKILSLDIKEGDSVSQNKIVGIIDTINLQLQKEQVEASIAALKEKTSDIQPQVKLLEDQLAVQQSQLANMQHEKERTENLLKEDAATGKQLDDMNYQIDVILKQIAVTKQQITVQRSNVKTQNSTVLSEDKPMQKRVAQLNDQLQRGAISNPIAGTVLTKYAEAGEITSAGKALYKVADLSSLNLRAYVSGGQLPSIKLGQQVKVLIDKNANDYKEYSGTISWISDKAEFTPKTIQTKDERANLVYAIKIRVKNDGYLKIGMYGEVKF